VLRKLTSEESRVTNLDFRQVELGSGFRKKDTTKIPVRHIRECGYPDEGTASAWQALYC